MLFTAGIYRRLDRIENLLLRVLSKQGVMLHMEVEMAGELDTLEADVTAQSTVIDSAVTLLNGLKAKLDAAIASGDMSRVAAVNAEIEAKTAALASAVQANTPTP